MPVQPGLRPTPDRVRETLFNWLQADIAGADCLDLFAGTGALGFEAASRGARAVAMIERDPAQAERLREQAGVFGAGNIAVTCTDGVAWLEQTGDSFDIIFLDPPFGGDLLCRGLTILASRAILRPSGLVYVEQGRGETLPAGWDIYKQTRAGRVEARLLKLQPPDSGKP